MRRFKLKVLRVCLSVGILINILDPLPLTSYRNNAVESNEFSVNCETYRGLNESYNDYLLYTKVNEQESITVTPTEEPIVKDTKEKCNKWGIKLTKEEIKLLAKIVWLEARGESDSGEIGVVEVVLNRMIHKDLKGSLTEVLSRKNAFSTWKFRNEAKPTKREYRNIYKVLNGNTDLFDYDVVYFSTFPRNKYVAAHIGNHYFCYYELD